MLGRKREALWLSQVVLSENGAFWLVNADDRL